MISRQLVMSTAIVLALSACSGKTFKQFEVAPGAPSLSVDATQRFLLVKTGSSGDVIVCAEPSPDAAMAVAAQIAGSGVLPSGLQAGLSGARSEALASLGLRTPAIQLVRDLWYRACEGSINGIHSEAMGQVGAAESTTEASIATNATGGGTMSGKTGTKAGTQSTSLIIQPLPAGSKAESAAEAITEIFRMFLIVDTPSAASLLDARRT
jgi:hypothetical protein